METESTLGALREFSGLSGKWLIETATEALVAQINKTTEKVSKTAGVFLTACIDKWAYEFLSDLGLENRASRIPSAIPPWEIPDHMSAPPTIRTGRKITELSRG